MYEFNRSKRAVKVGGTWIYEYYLKDHLGNVRVAIDQNGTLLQKNNYYPFGLEHNNYTAIQQELDPKNRYKYNGKELNSDVGLEMLDYGARWYDSSIGRWNSVDPLAEDYYSCSTYNHVMENPIRYIDPNGRKVINDAIVPNHNCQDPSNRNHTLSKTALDWQERYNRLYKAYKKKKK